MSLNHQRTTVTIEDGKWMAEVRTVLMYYFLIVNISQLFP